MANYYGSNDYYGSSNNDTFTGNNNADCFYAMEGNDTLNGYGIHDSLLGTQGDDVVNGGSGDDNLWGDMTHSVSIEWTSIYYQNNFIALVENTPSQSDVVLAYDFQFVA